MQDVQDVQTRWETKDASFAYVNATTANPLGD
jgi:hypothetical protein